MKKSTVRILIDNALIAALYFIISLLLYPLSFEKIQIRLAEALILLCFFRRDLCLGVTAGCLLINVMSPFGIIDVIFGTLATLLSCLIVSYLKHLFLASLVPVLINGLFVGLELSLVLSLPFAMTFVCVTVGEFIAVSLIGYLLFLAIGRRSVFLSLIGARRNTAFRW